MKKELALHFLISIIFCLPVFILRYLFLINGQLLSAVLFWVGVIIGTLLPDLDHLIYVYFLRPTDLTSQRVMYQAQKGNISESLNLLSNTNSERTNLILHTILFQIVFLLLSFLVITSSASLLGRGLVIAFLLHILFDEIKDRQKDPSLSAWFKNIPIRLDQMQLNIYLIANAVIIFLFGFVF